MTPIMAINKKFYKKRDKILEGDAENLLKNYRYSRGRLKSEVDAFLEVLPDTLRTFATYRYKKLLTMEEVAEKMGYSIRSAYSLRKNLLLKWILFLSDIP